MISNVGGRRLAFVQGKLYGQSLLWAIDHDGAQVYRNLTIL
jgi:hypothetical protein